MFRLDRFEGMQPRGAALEARRILVATDLGVASEEAIRAADAWADLRGSELLACHVGGPLERGTSIPAQPPEAAPDPLTALDRTMVRQQLRSVLGRRSTDVPVYIASGEPGPGIAAVAEALRADLVVVGAPRGSRPPLVGSVAEDVVRLTRCAVLTVRPATGTRDVLVPADLSDDLLTALRAAAGVARKISGRVTLVHAVSARRELHAAAVIGLASMAPPGWWADAGEDDRLDMPALPELLRRLGVEAEARMYREDPIGAILETVEALRPELCVVALDASCCSMHGSLRSTARTLIRAGTCSVLVVRPVRATA